MIEDQPPPRPTTGRPVWETVVEDMQARDAVGRERYGVPLQAGNGRDMLVDAYQEGLDLVVYLRGAILERGLDVPAIPHRAALAEEVARLRSTIERRRAAGRASREALEEENRRLRRQIAELSDRIPLGPLDNLSMMPMPPPPPTHYPPRASGSVPCIVCGAPSYIPCLPTCPIKRAVPA